MKKKYVAPETQRIETKPLKLLSASPDIQYTDDYASDEYEVL